MNHIKQFGNFEAMFDKYGEMIPDYIIDALYKQIKKSIEIGGNYDHYMRVFDTLNGGKIPDIIKSILP